MRTSEETADPEILDALRTEGLIGAEESARFFRIPGGVSANVWRVEAGGRRFCVKQALEQLRVADTWHAPTSRCAAEAEWLRLASTVGINVPTVLAELPEHSATVMSWIDTDSGTTWKQQLLDGVIDAEFAAAVGRDIVAVHRATAGDARVAARFENPEAFDALRLEPYFEHSISKNPQVADELAAVVEQQRTARIALVHGDVTPKNIMVDARPVILDAEVATYGDPAFDAALCCTHLLLKSALRPQHLADYLQAMASFSDTWFAEATWEPRAALESRVGRLIGAILIARVDGKSPADYLVGHPGREIAREAGRRLISGEEAPFEHVTHTWREAIREVTNEGTRPR